MSLIFQPNQIRLRFIHGHTVFLERKQLVPEHSIQQHEHPQLPTFDCLTDAHDRSCDCPPQHRCVPLLAKRIGLMLRDSQPLRYTRQVLVAFQRTEAKLTRRNPPKRFGPFEQTDTPSLQAIYQDTSFHNNNQQHTRPPFPEPQPLTEPHHFADSNPHSSLDSRQFGPEPPRVAEREKNLLLRVDAKDGEVVRGERLSARETLRRLAYHGESDQLGTQEVERYWLLWVPRGFERLAVPYRVFRANRDALVWLLHQSELVSVDPPPELYQGMFFTPGERRDDGLA